MSNQIITEEIKHTQQLMDIVAKGLDKDITECRRLNIVNTMVNLHNQIKKSKATLDK